MLERQRVATLRGACPFHGRARTFSTVIVMGILAWGGLAIVSPAIRSKPVTDVMASGAPERKPPAPRLPRHEQDQVDKAIEEGIKFLRRRQEPNGSFGTGAAWASVWEVGFAALPALALLECGVPPDDVAIQKTAKFIRKRVSSLSKTYDISLALLFLDRLREAEDRPLIHSLAIRLAARQTQSGGWGYDCPVLSKEFEEKYRQRLREGLHPKDWKKTPTKTPDPADNSNTQFAIVALWVAQRHDLPMGPIFAAVEDRFRSSQLADGDWTYRLATRLDGPYGSMTCAGLLGLAAGRSVAGKEGLGMDKMEDQAISRGIRALGRYLDDPSDPKMRNATRLKGPKSKVNPYFLWSVERVGILLDLETIGGKDWYRWGATHLVSEQNRDGSWIGTGAGGFPTVDTSFALLFLKRSDLLPQGRQALRKHLQIRDPGPDSKGKSSSQSETKTESSIK